MFQTLVVQPIYNILVAIYGIMPGHDLGVSLILFTILIRFAMWPLLKKQLRQNKAMQDLKPELKKIKKAAAGDKQVIGDMRPMRRPAILYAGLWTANARRDHPAALRRAPSRTPDCAIR